MARFRVHLDHVAITRMLKSQFALAVDEAAHAVADDVAVAIGSDPTLDPAIFDSVEVSPWVTDRARPAVRIAHPAGLAIEHKYGLLSKAAARQGLEVKGEAP